MPDSSNRDLTFTEATSETDSRSAGRKNYLLLIGIDRYASAPRLENAVRDTKALGRVLMERYQFEQANTVQLYDAKATRENIIEAFDDLSKKITKNDNLLIYYAGHGYYQNQGKKGIGYWVPVDARHKKVSDFIYHSTIKDYIETIPAHHTFLIVDSCFSGNFLRRDLSVTEGHADKVNLFPSRYCLAAGMIEKVADGYVGDHSPFAKSLITFLEKNEERRFPVLDLISHVSKATSSNAHQTPIGGVIFGTGDQNGQYVFDLKEKHAPKSKPVSPPRKKKEVEAYRDTKEKSNLLPKVKPQNQPVKLSRKQARQALKIAKQKAKEEAEARKKKLAEELAQQKKQQISKERPIIKRKKNLPTVSFEIDYFKGFYNLPWGKMEIKREEWYPIYPEIPKDWRFWVFTLGLFLPFIVCFWAVFNNFENLLSWTDEDVLMAISVAVISTLLILLLLIMAVDFYSITDGGIQKTTSASFIFNGIFWATGGHLLFEINYLYPNEGYIYLVSVIIATLSIISGFGVVRIGHFEKAQNHEIDVSNIKHALATVFVLLLLIYLLAFSFEKSRKEFKILLEFVAAPSSILVVIVGLILGILQISQKRFLPTFLAFTVKSLFGLTIVMTFYLSTLQLNETWGAMGFVAFWLIWVLGIGAFLLWGHKIKQQSEKG